MRVQKNNKAFAYRVPIGDYNYLQCTLSHYFLNLGNYTTHNPQTAKDQLLTAHWGKTYKLRMTPTVSKSTL